MIYFANVKEKRIEKELNQPIEFALNSARK